MGVHDTRRARSRRATLATLAALASLALVAGSPRPPPPHPEVLIVVNGESPVSVAIGEYYRQKRNVPASNVVSLSIPVSDPLLSSSAGHESTTRANFESEVRDPIATFLTDNGLTDQIVYIVVTKGVPLFINAGCGLTATYLRDCTTASVDAELALLFTGLDGTPGVETMVNPYFRASESFEAFRAAHPGGAPRYLVARLTGYQTDLDPETGVPADVKALIDNARLATTVGLPLVDEDPTQPLGRVGGNVSALGPAGATLSALGLGGIHDTDPTFVSDAPAVSAYASWGSNDLHDAGPPYYGEIGGKRYPGTFTMRAIAVDLVSTNARTFTTPATYGQSLIADLVALGVAGAAGYVREPTLAAVARPHILLGSYFTGVPAGEAYWRSIPYLGWTNVYVGDPLMKALMVATPVTDTDGDGVPDASDNCIEIPNPDQRDTNADGFGNVCDGDVNGDGLVTTSWGVTIPPSKRGDLEDILVTAQGSYDPDHDLDGDGDVDDADASIAQMSLFLPPGPSGLAP